MKSKLFEILFLSSALLCAGSCARVGYESFSGYAQGGVYTVKYNSEGVALSVGEVRSAVDSILEVIDFTLSGYNKASVLSRLNAGETVTLNDVFTRLYKASYSYYYESGGTVDVSSAPLYDIWGFGFTADSLPSGELVRSTLALCGMERLRDPYTMSQFCGSGASLCSRDLLRDTTQIPPKFNFNAVAQGFSCDLVAEYLHSIGVHDMLVDIGEIYCEGLNPRGCGWTVGVDNPVDGNNTPGADLKGIWESGGGACGIVTSGNYRKFYIKDGRKYSHTIDPRTGYPVTHPLLSATIVAPTAFEADAAATRAMVVGADAAMDFVDAKEGMEAYLICSDTLVVSGGFTLMK